MPVSIRLGPALEERLSKASRRLRLNKSEVIKRSLEAYLTEIQPGGTPYELGKDLFGADRGRETTLASGFKRHLNAKLRAKHRR